MAHRTFPASLRPRVVGSSFYPFHDNEILRTVDNTTQVIRRAVGRWRGLLEFGAAGVRSAEHIREVEAWIASLGGRLHTFDVPVVRRAELADLTSGTNLTLLTTPILVGGFVRMSVSGATTGLERGHMISVNGQAFRLETDLTSGAIEASPAKIVGAAGDTIEWEQPIQRARVSEAGVSHGRYAPIGFSGGWSLSWESENP